MAGRPCRVPGLLSALYAASRLTLALMLAGGLAACGLRPVAPARTSTSTEPTGAPEKQTAAHRAELKPGSPEALVAEGEELLAAGDVIQATERAYRARQADRRFAGAYNLLGVIYAQTRQPKEARANFSKAVAFGPKLSQPRVNLGRLELQESRPLEAEKQFTAATKLAPQDPEIWLLLARAQRMRQNRAAAGESFRRVLALDPKQAEAHAGLGLLDLDVDHYIPARDHLEQAVRLGDESPLTRCCLALALVAGQGTEADLQRAAQLLDEAKHPEMPPGWYAEGMLAQRKRDFTTARAAFQKLLNVEPRNERAWFALADAYRGAGDKTNAEYALRRHHELLTQRQRVSSLADRLIVEGPKPALLRQYGAALLDADQPADAEVQFQAWLARAPHDKEARAWLQRAQGARAREQARS